MSAIVVDVRSPRDFRSPLAQRRPFSVEVGDEYDAVGAGGSECSDPIEIVGLAAGETDRPLGDLGRVQRAHERQEASRRVGEARYFALTVRRRRAR